MNHRLLFAVLSTITVLAFVSPASAQVTDTGTLSITGTVQSSISLIFNSDPAGVTLNGAGTNNAALPFGNIQAYGGTISPGVTRTTGADSFTVSSPVGVHVRKANSSSANYTLTAVLNGVDATNSWQVSGVTVVNGAAATITTSGTYDSDVSNTVAVTIPFSTANGTAIDNSIGFTASAN